MPADHPNAKPASASPVRVIASYKIRLSELKSVSTSTTIAAALGVALAVTDAEVRLISNGSLHFNPSGTADATNAKLPTDFTIPGGKSVIDTAEIFSASAQDVGIIVYEVYTGI